MSEPPTDEKSEPVVLTKAGDPHPMPRLVPYQFKPGQSGNPGGRRPGSASFEAVITKLLDELVTVEAADGQTVELSRREQIAQILIDEIVDNRNPAVLKELMARIWPTPQGDAATILAGSVQSWVDIVRDRAAELEDEGAGEAIPVKIGS